MPTEFPAFVVCCRVSDPDPACVAVPGAGVGFCSKCTEAVRVSPDSAKYLFDGAMLLCVQCAVELPELIFARGAQGFRDAVAVRALLLGHDVEFPDEETAERVFDLMRRWHDA